MINVVFRGPTTHRPWYFHRIILNRINHKIARQNAQKFPQLAIFSFDHIGLGINLEGRYERDSLDVLQKFLTQHLGIDTNTTVVDVGANIGNHSVFFSTIFSAVFAFEPNPYAYSLLKHNSFGSNICALNHGLSNANSTLIFAENPTNLGASRIVDEHPDRATQNLRSRKIEVRRLDDNLEIKNQVISLIKIDVEGHELQVLEGAVELIEKAHPIVVFEQSEDAIVEGTSQVINFLHDRDYRFFTIRDNFDLGDKFLAKLASLILRSIFGFKKNVVPTRNFKKMFYSMIIAVPA